ncbi:MAG: glutamate--tRNA ligase [Chitinophagaceae bacterium]|nr:glutamate--tRNA ligase [Chitinophagales bacterium]
MNKKVRVRFAPSPTGGLHLGGVRTALFNYLFAKKNNGSFIIRIEDTDQTRFVAGAEQYIYDTLNWCGLTPDESPLLGGNFAPYKQSERKALYKQYAEQLIAKGVAYYAFDTAQELEEKRAAVANFQYNFQSRMSMKNSLTLSKEETEKLLKNNTPYVIRILMPANETISFTDMIRGEVHFNSSLIDDKILLKNDAMPTYHLAVIVDDYLMQISHVFRGEEWLPSSPIHILLWKYLFGLENMPQWAHLPLILKPDGNGKLSKRDGERLGFPVFAMDWHDPKTYEKTIGFKERGFLPQAFVNMLAMLGWNDGSAKEIFTLQELIEQFSLERVHKAGAKFDYEKAKWFNHEWIKKMTTEELKKPVKNILLNITNNFSDEYLTKVIELVKDRCTLLADFNQQASFFFKSPETIDIAAIQAKWDEKKKIFFEDCLQQFEAEKNWTAEELEKIFKALATTHQIKIGELMLPFRIMLVGEKFGPAVFEIAALIGKETTVKRMEHVLELMKK